MNLHYDFFCIYEYPERNFLNQEINKSFDKGITAKRPGPALSRLSCTFRCCRVVELQRRKRNCELLVERRRKAENLKFLEFMATYFSAGLQKV